MRLNLARITQAARTRGLRVGPASGAAGRGARPRRPKVIVVHGDIISGCPSTPPGVIAAGVQQPHQYVPGPLYNFWVACDATVWPIADGISNNAGIGGWRGIFGNSRTIGVCMSGHTHNRAQIDAAATLCAVLAGQYRIATGNVIGHKEWTSRKSDPVSVDMAAFRRQIDTARLRPLTPEVRRKLTALARQAAEGRQTLRLTFPKRMTSRDVHEARYALGMKRGRYGRRVARRVKAFQRWMGLPVTGEVDAKTWPKLMFFYFARAWGYT